MHPGALHLTFTTPPCTRDQHQPASPRCNVRRSSALASTFRCLCNSAVLHPIGPFCRWRPLQHPSTTHLSSAHALGSDLVAQHRNRIMDGAATHQRPPAPQGQALPSITSLTSTLTSEQSPVRLRHQSDIEARDARDSGNWSFSQSKREYSSTSSCHSFDLSDPAGMVSDTCTRLIHCFQQQHGTPTSHPSQP